MISNKRLLNYRRPSSFPRPLHRCVSVCGRVRLSAGRPRCGSSGVKCEEDRPALLVGDRRRRDVHVLAVEWDGLKRISACLNADTVFFFDDDAGLRCGWRRRS